MINYYLLWTKKREKIRIANLFSLGLPVEFVSPCHFGQIHSPYLFIMLKFARFLCCSCCYAQSLAYFENFIISMGAKGDYGSTQYLRFAIKFKYF